MVGGRRVAILEGVQGAKRLHAKLGSEAALERGETRIDVFGTTLKEGAELLFKSLKGLLGAYLNQDEPGILVSTNRELHVQRFTGAHELGHFFLGHNPSVDTEVGLWRSGKGRSDLQEVAADAFASEFLMPRWLYVHHARRHGWKATELHRPEVVYQLSLRMGVSYEAACWGLSNHGILTDAKVRQLLQHEPKAIKKALLPGIELENPWANVWELTADDDNVLVEGGPDDIFLFRLSEHAAAGYLWDEEPLAQAGFTMLRDRHAPTNKNEVGGDGERLLVVRAREPGEYHVQLGEQRPWMGAMSTPRATVALALDLQGKEKGLPRLRRKTLAAA